MFANDPDTEFAFGVFYLSAMCGHGIIAGIAALWIWWYGVIGSQQTAEQNAQEAIEDGKTDDEARVGHGQPPVKRRRTTALAQDVDWTRGVDRPTGSIAVELATLLRRQFETLVGAIGFRSRHGPDRGASVLESPAAQCGVPRAEEVKGFASGAGCSTDLSRMD